MGNCGLDVTGTQKGPVAGSCVFHAVSYRKSVRNKLSPLLQQAWFYFFWLLYPIIVDMTIYILNECHISINPHNLSVYFE
jgi:hypothetical protein